MTKEQKAAVAKALYLSGHTIDEIASILGVSRRTIQNYKQRSWDEERARRLMESSDEKLYENFLEYMHAFLKEIKESDLKPDVKAEKIAQIGDSFAKMRKIAQMEDPQGYALAIVRHTIKTILTNAPQRLGDECAKKLIELIETIQNELADVAV